MEKKEECFTFTYSAREQEEIRTIRSRYAAADAGMGREEKMNQLRRMDEAVTRKVTAVSLAFGLAGTLLLGIGMCCCLVWADAMFIPGIIIGIAGIGILGAAYPVYNRTLHRQREKIASEIIRLTDELMK